MAQHHVKGVLVNLGTIICPIGAFVDAPFGVDNENFSSRSTSCERRIKEHVVAQVQAHQSGTMGWLPLERENVLKANVNIERDRSLGSGEPCISTACMF